MAETTKRKRDREFQVQAWFDPETPTDRRVIEVFEYYKTRPEKEGPKLNSKATLIEIVRLLDGGEAPPEIPTVRDLASIRETLQGVLREMRELRRSGIQAAGADSARSWDGVDTKLTALEQNLADSFASFEIPDDED